MLAYFEDADAENKENTNPSRFEELIQQYQDPVKALVHELLEKYVQEEFQEFIGPRIGKEIFRESDGKPVVEYRNGVRNIKQAMVDTLALNDFRMPRSRAGGFRSGIFARARRRAGKFAGLALELFVNGVSNRKVRRSFERAGMKIGGLSKSSVSRISKELMREYLVWSNRKITRKFIYLQADAVYIRIRRKSPRKMGTLMIIGIGVDGYKEVLHFTLGSESERNYDEAIDSLARRGLDIRAVHLITLDGAAGPLKSSRNIFGEERIQRCTIHKTQNILQKTPLALREEIKARLNRLWNQPSRVQAEKYLVEMEAEYKDRIPAAMECLLQDKESLLRYFDFPAAHWKTIRNTNLIERVIRETRRRTKVMDTLDTEYGCYGILMGVVREQNERWMRKSHWRNAER